jgi:hypothetical protein
MKLHRILTIICVVAATAAPMVAAMASNQIATVFRRHFAKHPDAVLPMLTQWWIVQARPIVPISLLFSLMVLVGGIVLFKKNNVGSSGNWLLLLCTLAFVAANILLGSVALAAMLPFVGGEVLKPTE